MRNKKLSILFLSICIGISCVLLDAVQNRGKFHHDISHVLSETSGVLVSTFGNLNQGQIGKADISLMFADLKYIDGNLKFCEFGSVQGAGGHEYYTPLQLYQDTFYLKSPYWEFFWHYLATLKKPVWLISPDPHNSQSNRLTKDVLAWETFVRLGGSWVKNIKDLVADKKFIKCLHESKQFDASNLQSFSGIIVNMRRSTAALKKMHQFSKQYPNFLVIGSQTREFVAYKSRGSAIFQYSGLEEFKPRWGKYPAEYKPDLAAKIIRDIGSELYVIKPTNSMRARGVFIESKEKLDISLKKILGPSREHETTYGFWEQKRKSIHVEQYCPSKTLMVDGKRYDPTMRIFFALRYDAGKLYTTVFGGFLKVPEKHLDEHGSLTEKHVTVPGDHEKVALKIEQKDLQKVRGTLKAILPKLYYSMLKYQGTFEKSAAELFIQGE